MWTAVAVLAAVVFGGTGMQPGDLTGPATRSWRFGGVLVASWVLLVIPVGRAILDPRGSAYLRALPVARWRRGAITAGIAVAAQGPWTLLWWLGAGAAAGAIATAGAAATMLAIAEVADRIVWPHRTPRWRGAIRAVIGAHVRVLRRERGAALVRAAGIAALGGALAGMIARANQLAPAEAVWWVLAVGAIALPMAVGALALPVLDTDRKLDWLLRTSGCSWPARVLAAGVVLAAVGVALAAVAAGTCALVGRASAGTAAGQLAWLAVLGGGVGALALRVGAWAVVTGDGSRVVIGMAVVAIAGFVAIGVLGVAGAAAVAVIGASIAASVASPRGGEAPP